MAQRFWIPGPRAAHASRNDRSGSTQPGVNPRQFGSGGKQRSGGISKQGDRTLRCLLVVGASAHLRQERRRGVKDPWLRGLLERRPVKVATVARAAKTARIIWAMLVTGECYRGAGQGRSMPAPAAA